MDAFVRKFCEKYSLPITVSLQLLEKMEKFSFRKGDFLVHENIYQRPVWSAGGDRPCHARRKRMRFFGRNCRETRYFI